MCQYVGEIVKYMIMPCLVCLGWLQAGCVVLFGEAVDAEDMANVGFLSGNEGLTMCFIASVDRQTFGAAALDRDVYQTKA